MKIAHSIKYFAYLFSGFLFAGLAPDGNPDEIPLGIAIIVSLLIIVAAVLLIGGGAVYFINR